jgi:hypothetical protein
MTTYVPGNPPTRGVAAKNLEEPLRRTLADRDGHHVDSLTPGGWGGVRSERIGCSAHRCAVMSATVVPEVVRQVVQSHTGADACSNGLPYPSGQPAAARTGGGHRGTPLLRSPGFAVAERSVTHNDPLIWRFARAADALVSVDGYNTVSAARRPTQHVLLDAEAGSVQLARC